MWDKQLCPTLGSVGLACPTRLSVGQEWSTLRSVGHFGPHYLVHTCPTLGFAVRYDDITVTPLLVKVTLTALGATTTTCLGVLHVTLVLRNTVAPVFSEAGRCVPHYSSKRRAVPPALTSGNIRRGQRFVT